MDPEGYYPFLQRHPRTWTDAEHRLAFVLHMRRQAEPFHQQMVAELQLPLAYGGKGYGGSDEWPFDTARAIASPGYLKGIIRATLAGWASPTWMLRASERLQKVVRPRLEQKCEELAEIQDMLYRHSLVWPDRSFR